MADLSDFLDRIDLLRTEADLNAQTSYEKDPSNNGKEAQMWADIATLLDQVLIVEGPDDTEAESMLGESTSQVVPVVTEIETSGDGDPSPAIANDPWSDRY